MLNKEERFIKDFESCKLSKNQFDHSNHLQMAYIYLQKNSYPEALILIRDGIQKFAKHHQADDLYHETITFFYSSMINERLVKNSFYSWEDFENKNQDIFCSAKEFISKFYPSSIWADKLAKNYFILPSNFQ